MIELRRGNRTFFQDAAEIAERVFVGYNRDFGPEFTNLLGQKLDIAASV